MGGLNLKALDDLYIDDEGDDDIQLADEASGLGPLKPGKNRRFSLSIQHILMVYYFSPRGRRRGRRGGGRRRRGGGG